MAKMTEVRDIKDQPGVVHLMTSLGHLSSEPMEWAEGQKNIEYTFQLKRDCFINGYVIAHPDGVIFYQSEPMMMRMSAGPFTVKATFDGQCDNPDCTECK